MRLTLQSGYRDARKLAGFLFASFLVPFFGPVQSADANAFAWLTQDVYGPNEEIVIDLGMINCFPAPLFGSCTHCPPPGQCDHFTCTDIAARAYIVPHGIVKGDAIVDLDELAVACWQLIIQPTATSGFWDTPIGLTGPAASGGIVDGAYDVIFDQCQNGVFDPAKDAVVATFSVEGVLGAPGGALGATALELQEELEHQLALLSEQLTKERRVVTMLSVAFFAESVSRFAKISMTGLFAGIAIEFTLSMVSDVVPYASKLQSNQLQSLSWSTENRAEQTQRLILLFESDCGIDGGVAGGAIDFTEVALLLPGEALASSSPDSLNSASMRYARWSQLDTRLIWALMDSVERFRAAVAAGEASYALLQARAISRYGQLYSEVAPVAAESAMNFVLALEEVDLDFTSATAYLAELQSRINMDGTGFTSAELVALTGLGIQADDFVTLAETIHALDASTSAGEELAAAVAAIKDNLPVFIAAVESLVVAADAEVDSILDTIVPEHPVAKVVASAVVEAGQTFSASAAGSSHPQYPLDALTFEWDLNGNGEFDDAIGEVIEVTIDLPDVVAIGVHITDPDGRSDIAYVVVEVEPVHSTPLVIQSPVSNVFFSPKHLPVVLSIMTGDTDGNPLSVTWTLNDEIVEMDALEYTYLPKQVGLDRVLAIVSDGLSTSTDGLAEWVFLVSDMPAARVQPSVVDFGKVAVGAIAEDVIVVFNDGVTSLELGGIEIVPTIGDFQIVGSPSALSIQPGESAAIEVMFSPADSGPQAATIFAATNDLKLATIEVEVIANEADPGDLNDDGVVDVSDLLILLSVWGPCPKPIDCPADLNGDGSVDVSDLLMLLANWG